MTDGAGGEDGPTEAPSSAPGAAPAGARQAAPERAGDAGRDLPAPRATSDRRLFLAMWGLYLLFGWPVLSALGGRQVALAEALSHGRVRVMGHEQLLGQDFSYPDGPEQGGVSIFGFLPSALSVPLCWVGRALYGPEQEATRWAVEAALMLALVVALPAALTVVLLRRLLVALAVPRAHEAAVVFGAGTVAFPLATVINHQSLSMALVAAGLLLLLAGPPAPGRAWSAGALVGAGVLSDFGALFPLAAPIGVFALVRGDRRQRLAFVLGAALPAAVLLTWNHACYGSPLRTPPPATLDAALNETLSQRFHNLDVPSWRVARELLLHDRIGLFVFMPALLVGFAGWPALRRRRPAAAWLVAGIVAAGLLQICAHRMGWHGGLSPGPRYLLPVAFALTLPLGYGLARFPRAALAPVALSLTFAWTLAQTPLYGSLRTALHDLVAYGPRLRAILLVGHHLQPGADWEGTAAWLSPLVAIPALTVVSRALLPARSGLARLGTVTALWALAALPSLLSAGPPPSREDLRAAELVRFVAREEEPYRLEWDGNMLMALGRERAAAIAYARAIEVAGQPRPRSLEGLRAASERLAARGDLAGAREVARRAEELAGRAP